MQRTFVCGPGQADTAYLPPALVAYSLVSRIEAVSCSSACAPLLSAYDEMQSCTRLAVSVAEDEPLRSLSRALALPALDCVEISSSVGSRVRTAELVAFLESAVRPMSRAVRVKLVGVRLVGPPVELGQRFMIVAEPNDLGKDDAV